MTLKTQRHIYFSLPKLSRATNLKKSVVSGLFSQPDHFYRTYRLKKQAGGYRNISIPNPSLYLVQKAIANELNSLFSVHDASHGFVKNRSIISNAKIHVGGRQFLQTDISDFFGSCARLKLSDILEPVSRGDDTLEIIKRFCFLNSKLPQGAPSSPILSNIFAKPLDEELWRYASENLLKYSRYADDLNLSGKQIPISSLREVREIMEAKGFRQNKRKTRLINSGQKVIITGISISRGALHLPKKKKRQIRRDAHFLSKNGVLHESSFNNSYDPFYYDRIMGQLSYWLQVEPKNPYPKKMLSRLGVIGKLASV